MNTVFEPYDHVKVERLKNHVLSMAAKNEPVFYKIEVDGLAVVPRTDKTSGFEELDEYLNPDSKNLCIWIFNKSSRDGMKYIFRIKESEGVSESLNGLGIIDGQTYSNKELKKMAKDRETIERLSQEHSQFQQQIQYLQAEIQRKDEEHKNTLAAKEAFYKNELEQKENYYQSKLQQTEEAAKQTISEKNKQIETLQSALVAIEEHYKKEGLNVGDVLMGMGESLLKHHNIDLSKIPLVGELSGMFQPGDKKTGEENQPQTEKEKPPDTQASYQRYEEEEETKTLPLDEEQKSFLKLFEKIRKHFSESDLEQSVEILGILAERPRDIQAVLDFLNKGSTIS